MGLISQRYIPHCCLVFITEKNYLTKIIKCDEELILKILKVLRCLKENWEVNYQKSIFLYEKSQMEMKFIFGSVNPKKEKFIKYVCGEKPIDIFFGIGEGRVYGEEGRFNTEDEGKRKILDDNGYLINNPNYRFKEYEKDNSLFRCCKLG